MRGGSGGGSHVKEYSRLPSPIGERPGALCAQHFERSNDATGVHVHEHMHKTSLEDAQHVHTPLPRTDGRSEQAQIQTQDIFQDLESFSPRSKIKT